MSARIHFLTLTYKIITSSKMYNIFWYEHCGITKHLQSHDELVYYNALMLHYIFIIPRSKSPLLSPWFLSKNFVEMGMMGTLLNSHSLKACFLLLMTEDVLKKQALENISNTSYFQTSKQLSHRSIKRVWLSDCDAVYDVLKLNLAQPHRRTFMLMDGILGRNSTMNF